MTLEASGSGISTKFINYAPALSLSSVPVSSIIKQYVKDNYSRIILTSPVIEVLPIDGCPALRAPWDNCKKYRKCHPRWTLGGVGKWIWAKQRNGTRLLIQTFRLRLTRLMFRGGHKTPYWWRHGKSTKLVAQGAKRASYERKTQAKTQRSLE